MSHPDARLAERKLRQSLTIVERACYRDGGNVPSERAHLATLSVADALTGEEGHDPVPLQSVEGACHGSACVTRGGYEHGSRGARGFGVVELAHQVGHEAGTDIFKCVRGAVVQLQHVNARFDFHKRNREGERRSGYSPHDSAVDLAR